MSEIEQHQADVQFMKECIAAELIKMIMSDRQCTIEEAMNILYCSRTFARLDKESTKLYTQSPVYLYDLLLNE